MNIALLIPWFLPNRGGAEIGAWELGRRLVRHGHRVSVITPRYRLDWPAREELRGIQIFRYLSLAPSSWRRVSEVAHCLQALPGVSRLLDSIQPDLVHLHYMFFTGYAGMRWARRHGRPAVLSLVGNDVYDPYYVPCGYLHPLNRWMIRHANEVVAASRFVRNAVEEKFGRRPREIPVIPYGVDLDRFVPSPEGARATLRQQLGLPRENPLVLTVQRLHERKGVHVYLDAAHRVLREERDAAFVIVGDGPERTNLEARARSLGISEKVRFTGKVPDEDLPRYYQACDLFAFHTIHEGFGIVLLEAMACAKPVVTTRAGGTLDIVQPGENGLLVEPRDPEGFAQAILALLKNPDRAKAIGRRNRQRVETHYAWDSIAERYLTLYQKLLPPRRAVQPAARTLQETTACL